MQPGWGHNGTTFIVDPIYIWNQTGDFPYAWSFQGSPGDWSTVVQLNRDIFVNNGAKPGYTKYTYPHPARAVVEGGGTDTIAPTPNPMTFSVSPTAVDAFSVTMTASAATDDQGGTISYFFNQTGAGAGGTDSGWQSGVRTYTDTGLSPSTTYTYRVKARDSSLNETAYSGTVNVTTPSASPGSVNIGTLNVTNLRVGP